MSLNYAETILAAGCEDGVIRLYDVQQPGQVNFLRSFEPHPGRVLSLSWDISDRHVYSGSSCSAVCKWEANSGRAVNVMKIDSNKKAENVLVWTVSSLR